MAKHIFKGWSKPGDVIPQPISVVLGRNLRPSSKTSSSPPEKEGSKKPSDQLKETRPQGNKR
jgi:hypothetical protein